MRNIKEIGDIRGKKVLLRTDLDVAIRDRKIVENFRIKKQKDLIEYLIKGGAKVVAVAHISDLDSFTPILNQIQDIWGFRTEFIKNPESIGAFLNSSQADLGLLENIRSFEGEKDNREDFAKKLATGFDFYVNNSFAVCHRNQASVVAITKFLPSFAGDQLIKEINYLSRAISEPSESKVVIIGGAKTETKIPVIKSFINKADKILIGGVVANDYLKVRGFETGDSKTDNEPGKLFGGIDLNNPKIIYPQDFVISESKILDIGPKTADNYVSIIKSAKMVIWNGPMGLFEDERFISGTKRIAEAVVEVPENIIGGGDTVSAVDGLGFLNKYKFVSTGGGAMLEFLAGKQLPGLVALNT
jgi:phosphoglycerate kinase